jgi:hypothetical protein
LVNIGVCDEEKWRFVFESKVPDMPDEEGVLGFEWEDFLGQQLLHNFQLHLAKMAENQDQKEGKITKTKRQEERRIGRRMKRRKRRREEEEEERVRRRRIWRKRGRGGEGGTRNKGEGRSRVKRGG